MGPVLSHSWDVYGRDSEDNWLPNPIHSSTDKYTDCQFHMGRFKHRFFMFVNDKRENAYLKIYLYQGWRKVKCEKRKEIVTVTFSNTSVRNNWDTCRRSRLGKKFDQNWLPAVKTDCVYIYNRIIH